MAKFIIKYKSDSMWNVDLGVTQYMWHELKGFVKYVKSKEKQVVYLGDNSTSFIIERYGNVNVKLINGDEKIILNILYVSRLTKNFFSIKQLDKIKRQIYIKA